MSKAKLIIMRSMLRTYSFKRRAMLVLFMSFAILVAAIMAQSANAQASDKKAITTFQEARTYLSGGREFQVDTIGLGNNPGDHVFRIARFDQTAPSSSECPSTTCHTAMFHGYYRGYNDSEPSEENVHGTITVIDIVRARRVRGILTKITFTANAQLGVPGIVIGGTDFDGAIRFAEPGSQERTFMAGTFTVHGPDGASRSGPFPFSGIPLPIYR
jgi:hypothetical protein